MLIAESTSLAKMAGVLFRLSESSRMGLCPLLFHACQHTTLLCLGVPVGASRPPVGVVIVVGGMDQRQGVVSESVAFAGRCLQPIEHERCDSSLVTICPSGTKPIVLLVAELLGVVISRIVV